MRTGPWTTKYQDRCHDELCVRDAAGSIVADLRMHATAEEARLIAAAPDLLNACRKALRFIYEHQPDDGYTRSGMTRPEVAALLAAINKATPTPEAPHE